MTNEKLFQKKALKHTTKTETTALTAGENKPKSLTNAISLLYDRQLHQSLRIHVKNLFKVSLLVTYSEQHDNQRHC